MDVPGFTAGKDYEIRTHSRGSHSLPGALRVNIDEKIKFELKILLVISAYIKY